jgi:type 1 glutamine amidotransferase
MPEGLLEGLTKGQIRDLLTFLLHAPPQRTRRDLKAVLQPLPTAESQKDLNIVLVAGRQDHGPGEHDYPACQQLWHELLEAAPNVRASNAWEWPTGEQFTSADVIVCYFWNRNWTDEQYEQLDRFLERGGGLVMLHSATIANTAPERLAERIGLSAQPGRTKYLHAPFDLVVQTPDHPLMAGLPQTIYFLDEPYWPMIGDMSRVTVLAGAEQEGELRPMLWTFERENGRVFGSLMGHYTWTHEDPFFQLLVLRGIAWACGEPVGRFESLMVP